MPYTPLLVVVLLLAAIVIFIYFYAKRARARTDSNLTAQPSDARTPTPDQPE
jgi:hypothetical protein